MKITLPLFLAFVNYMTSVFMYIDHRAERIADVGFLVAVINMAFIMVPAFIGSLMVSLAIRNIREWK